MTFWSPARILVRDLFHGCKEGVKNPAVWEEKPLEAEGDLHAPCFSWKGFVTLLYFKQQALKNATNNFWGQVISIFFTDFTVGQSLQRLFYIHCTKLSGRCFDPICEQIFLVICTAVLIIVRRNSIRNLIF